MLTLSQKVTCPFCCTTFAPQAIRFRCMAADCHGRTTDALFDRAISNRATGSKPTVLGRILVPPKTSPLTLTVPKSVICDQCKRLTTTRICPECHFELPADNGESSQRFIAIMGGRAAGKTHYIASLITRMQNEVGPQLRMTLRPLGNYAQTHWERNYASLFINKTLLPTTPSAEDNPQGNNFPVFRLTVDNAGAKQIVDIGLFDISGEDMQMANSSTALKRYIHHANGIIFLLDPSTFPNVQYHINHESRPDSSTTITPDNIVTILRNLFEAERLVRTTEKVKTPIAFTLSKVDTVQSLLDPGSPLHKPDVYNGNIEQERLQSVSTEVLSLFNSWINPNFGSRIKSEFATYAYFGVSALGRQADENNRLSAISPLHVEDPFLWLLLQLKILKKDKH